ncbi:TonB C-terminal domain-containing protein [Paracoccus xiamenensis]|uniref:TonB C-terminal domain-containing protein n=1 Tax=Paracoccus xiamenensis TaxID=2714901 RepID=UPI00140CE572|nr:TonB C-terminal domain-containing protein [Paracoccus xiamenensis]NHF73840.1 energy transducer TonB [Paracoccus xiamenensis]
MSWSVDGLRWGGFGALVAAAHVAGGLWIERASKRHAVMMLPAPIFAELLPAPAAPAPPAEAAAAEETASLAEPEPEPEAQTEPEPEPEPAPEPEPEPEPELPEPEPAPDFEVPPLTELPPVTDFADLLPESALALTASDRPITRPERRKPEPQQVRREEKPKPPKEQPKRETRRERTTAPTQQTERAAPAETATSQRRGGPAGQTRASTGASKAKMDSWTSRVGGRVASHMKRTRVPGGGRGSVTIQVSVSISGNGSAAARLASSTGNAKVDAALARQAGRMPRMPAPPNGKGASFVLPIRIDL